MDTHTTDIETLIINKLARTIQEFLHTEIGMYRIEDFEELGLHEPVASAEASFDPRLIIALDEKLQQMPDFQLKAILKDQYLSALFSAFEKKGFDKLNHFRFIYCEKYELTNMTQSGSVFTLTLYIFLDPSQDGKLY